MTSRLGPLLSALILCACGDSRAPASPSPLAPGRQVLWSADHETGDLSQWYAGDGGGEFNSGAASSSVSTDVAHTGRYSARGSINAGVVSGVRLFRWTESHANREAFYSVWFFFPERYAVQGWWNVFQFKSRNGAAVNDPFWFLQIANRPGGAMYLSLGWWDGLSIEGPGRGEFGGQNLLQALAEVPVGRWTHVQVFLRQSSEFDGQIVVWQDAIELFNRNNVRTRYPASNGANEWSVNNYGHGIVPNPATIYVDDAMIETRQ